MEVYQLFYGGGTVEKCLKYHNYALIKIIKINELYFQKSFENIEREEKE